MVRDTTPPVTPTVALIAVAFRSACFAVCVGLGDQLLRLGQGHLRRLATRGRDRLAEPPKRVDAHQPLQQTGVGDGLTVDGERVAPQETTTTLVLLLADAIALRAARDPSANTIALPSL